MECWRSRQNPVDKTIVREGGLPVEADGDAEALEVDGDETGELARVGRASGLQTEERQYDPAIDLVVKGVLTAMESQHCSVPVEQVEPEPEPGLGAAKVAATRAKTVASLKSIVTEMGVW